MKLFCSNAFTGEDFNVVSDRMRLVVDTLNEVGYEAYCPVFDPHKIDMQSRGETKEIFDYAFENLHTCDGMVAIVTSDRKSEGQLLEIGALLSEKKPLYLFLHKSVADSPSHLVKLAAKTSIWESEEELEQSLANL